MTHLPYLIQRVRARKHPGDAKGIDRLFEFDYMGSSEFEFGTLGKALKIMRATKTPDWKVETIQTAGENDDGTTSDLVAYFVGDPKDLETAKKLLEDQLQKCPQHRPQERTAMRESFGLEECTYRVYDGWWTVDAGWSTTHRPTTPFVIFRWYGHAEMWLGEL